MLTKNFGRTSTAGRNIITGVEGVEVLELALAVWVAGPIIVLIWLTGPALLNLLRRLPASCQHYAHTRQRSPNWRQP